MNITFTNYTNMVTEAELLFIAFLFAWKFPRRDHFFYRAFGFSLIAIGLAFPLRSIDCGNAIVNGAINYFLLFLFVWSVLPLCYRLHLTSSLFFAIVAYTIRHLFYLVWEIVLTIIFQFRPELDQGFSWLWVVVALGVGLLGLPFAFQLLKRTWKYSEIILPSVSIIAISGVSLVINVILNLFVLETELPDQYLTLKYTNLAFNLFSSILILYLLFGLVQETQLEQDLQAVNQMRHEEEKQYALSKQTIDLINIKCHDLRKEIRTLQSTHDTISSEEIKTIEDATRIYDTRIKTGNASLDVILQEKALLCSKDAISFSCIADGNALSFMKEADIYTLFGNILDNAIESLEKNPNPQEKSIALKIRKTSGGVFAYEENPYQGNLAFRDGLPISTKGDDRYHGFGMKSIKATVERYEGTMSITSDNGLFCLSILFPSLEKESV